MKHLLLLKLQHLIPMCCLVREIHGIVSAAHKRCYQGVICSIAITLLLKLLCDSKQFLDAHFPHVKLAIQNTLESLPDKPLSQRE